MTSLPDRRGKPYDPAKAIARWETDGGALAPGLPKEVNTQGAVRLKRAYESPTAEDGKRILIDRLWPRGVSRKAAAIDFWAKDLAPSVDLRKWFRHDPARWQEFRRRYAAELQDHRAQLKELREWAQQGPVTLIYSARDEAHNDAVVLRDALLDL